MKKSKKKRKINKKIIICFLTLLLSILLIVTIYSLIDKNIKNIYIYGNDIISDQEIIELAQIEDYPNIFTTTKKEIKENIKNNKYIKEVSIKKKFYNEIHIYITEYKPLFIEDTTNKLVLDTNLKVTNDKHFLDVPTLLNYVPKEEYKNFINEYKELDKSIISKISQIKYDPSEYDENRYLFYMNDGNYVYVLTTKLDLINKYNDLITKLDGKKGILYLDSGNYFKIIK